MRWDPLETLADIAWFRAVESELRAVAALAGRNGDQAASVSATGHATQVETRARDHLRAVSLALRAETHPRGSPDRKKLLEERDRLLPKRRRHQSRYERETDAVLQEYARLRPQTQVTEKAVASFRLWIDKTVEHEQLGQEVESLLDASQPSLLARNSREMARRSVEEAYDGFMDELWDVGTRGAIRRREGHYSPVDLAWEKERVGMETHVRDMVRARDSANDGDFFGRAGALAATVAYNDSLQFLESTMPDAADAVGTAPPQASRPSPLPAPEPARQTELGAGNDHVGRELEP